MSVIPASPCGPIPRIEDRPKQLRFAQEANLDTVMMDMYRAERCIERGKTAATLFPESSVILTTTFEDERLELWFLERQIEVAVKFGANVVVPCDCPIYKDDPPLERRQTIEVYVENLDHAFREFGDYDISIIPLVKGTTPTERRICYEMFQKLGINTIGYYCAQYFLYGPRYHELLTRIRDITREFDPDSIMLIGFQSENWLPEFPPAVQAVAGFRWFWQSELNTESVTIARQNYEKWEKQVIASLQTGQSLLDSYSTQPTYGGL